MSKDKSSHHRLDRGLGRQSSAHHPASAHRFYDAFLNAIKYPGFRLDSEGRILWTNSAANRELELRSGRTIFDLVLPQDQSILKELCCDLRGGERLFYTQALLHDHTFAPVVLHLNQWPDDRTYAVFTPDSVSAKRQVGAQQTKILEALTSLSVDSLVRTLAHSLRRWTQSGYVIFIKAPPKNQSILRVLSCSFSDTSGYPKLVVDFLQRKIPKGGIDTVVNACAASFGFCDSLITEIRAPDSEIWGYLINLETKKVAAKSVRNLVAEQVAKTAEIALGLSVANGLHDYYPEAHEPKAKRTGGAGAVQAQSQRETVLGATASQVDHEQDEMRKTISNLNKENRALLVAKSAAETSASHQHTLLANISHEIRTPLSGIAGIVSLLEYTELSETQRTYVSALARSVESMTRIVNDCFDLSGLRSETIKLKSEPIALMPFLREICLNHRVKINEKGLRFCVVFPVFEEFIVNADRVRMRQVIDNLITNAVKFTTTGGITIEVSTESDSVVISIRDSGRGISQFNLENVFKRFFQENAPQDNHTSGLGIGLTISRQLVELMSGTIRAQNNTSGVGSTFEVGFPIAERRQRHEGFTSRMFEQMVFVLVTEDAHLAECATAAVSESLRVVHVVPGARIDENHELTEMMDRGISDFVLIYDNLPQPLEFAMRDQFPCTIREIHLSHNCFREAEGANVIFEPLCWDDVFSALRGGAQSTVESLNRLPVQEIHPLALAATDDSGDVHLDITTLPRVLLAEDDEINQFVLRQYLQKLGFEADVACNGREALELFEANPDLYAFYIFDCMMPELDGLSLTRSIRSREQKLCERRRTIIALTADAIKGREERCLEAGFDIFLTKPIKLSRLSEILEMVTSRQRTEGKNRAELHAV
jgi:signal transduction histidine kinase/CheY-like chemotaxis protein